MKLKSCKIKGFEANIQPNSEYSTDFYTISKIYDTPISSGSTKIFDFIDEIIEELANFDPCDNPTATIIFRFTTMGMIFSIPTIKIIYEKDLTFTTINLLKEEDEHDTISYEEKL